MNEERRGRLLAWLDRRLLLPDLSRFPWRCLFLGESRPCLAVPTSLLHWIVFLFLLVSFSGVLLALYYVPTPQAAYQSVLTISRDLEYGWLVRQVHFWAAQCLLLFLLLRQLRLLLRGKFVAPWEILWWAGLALFLLAAAEDAGGRALVRNNAAFWSTTRLLQILYSLPFLGRGLRFLLGGLPASPFFLQRVFLLHLLLLPLLLWGVLHLSFSSRRRITRTGAALESRTEPLSAPSLGLLLWAAVLTLAVLDPAPIGIPVQPLEKVPLSGIPWYLLAARGLVDLLPSWMNLSWRAGFLLLPLVVLGLLPLFEPLLPRLRGRGKGDRMHLAGALALGSLLGWLTLQGR